MEVSVIYAISERQPWINLDVPEDCTLEEAFELSGLAKRFPEIDLNSSKVGIFGKLATPDTALKPGDRVEIYRPLQVDPKAARRARAERSRQD